MQAYRPPVQPYFPQAPFPQSQPGGFYPQYAPYPGFMPPVGGQVQQPFPGVYPVEQYEASRPQFPTPGPRSKPLNRSQSAVVPPKPGPLKSIMKKKAHDRSTSVGGGAPMSRSRTNSTTHPRPDSRANSSTRSRADSNLRFVPDHLFLSLHGSSDIRVENIVDESLVEDFRETILPMWPHGVSIEGYQSHQWRTQFTGNPWTSSGTEAIIARRIVCRLFAVLANQGYSYLSTVNTSSQGPARLIFADSTPAPNAHFFSISISHSGDKLSILDAPPNLAQTLGLGLRDAFPRKIASDRATEEGIHVIELKRGAGGSEVQRSLFAAYVLQFFASFGYKLEGSFPFGRTSRLSFGSRKELWIFRGAHRRPGSSNGHRRRRPSRGADSDVRNQPQK